MFVKAHLPLRNVKRYISSTLQLREEILEVAADLAHHAADVIQPPVM